MARKKSESPVTEKATLLGFFNAARKQSSKSKGKQRADSAPPAKKRKRSDASVQHAPSVQEEDDSDIEIISQLVPVPAAAPRKNSPQSTRAAGSPSKRSKARKQSVDSVSNTSALATVAPAQSKVKSEAARVPDCSHSTRRPSIAAQVDTCRTVDLTLTDPPEDDVNAQHDEDLVISDDDWGEEPMAIDSTSDCEVVQGSSKDLEGIIRICPVCDSHMGDVNEEDYENHVSECVEAKAASRSPSTEKVRRPLSFLPSFSLPRFKAAKKEEEDAAAKGPPNAFTALMAGHAESKAWKVAQESDRMKGRRPFGEKRPVPFYKWIEGMQVTVDAFKYGKIEGCKGYFLSHAHSDHYQLLNASWNCGPIYCSITTANLIKLKLKVKDEYVKPLPMDQTVDIDGIKVTLIDANHCPGSVLFLFEGPHTDPKSQWSKRPDKIFRYLHCGDFRASPAHINHPALKGKAIEKCYLDTTYLNPKYCFPSQELVIEACASLVRSHVIDGDEGALYRVGGEEQAKQTELMKGWLDSAKAEKADETLPPDVVKLEADNQGKPKKKERLLVVVGTYSIGKERIVKAIAQALNTKIWGDDYKMALFEAQDDPVLQGMLTRDPLQAEVHVTNLHEINHDGLLNHLNRFRNVENGFTRLVGLRPTGWTFKSDTMTDKMPPFAKIFERERMRKFSPAGMYPQRDSTPLCLAFGVPYSEHSSFFELSCFALSLNYVRMIPTVNVGSEVSRKKMNDWFVRWQSEKKKRREAGLPDVVEYRNPNYW